MNGTMTPEQSAPHGRAEARIAAAILVRGHLVRDRHESEWWTLADAEGNEADVGTWMGRDRELPATGTP